MTYQADVIVTDFPWLFKTYSAKGKGKSPENHYPVMTLDDIKAIDISPITGPDCALFMWVIDSHLFQAKEVADAWGFDYSTVAFTWVKKTKHWKNFFGMGYLTRKNPEMVLYFTKGNPKRVHKGIPQLQEHRWRGHSRKPDGVYEAIQQLMGEDKAYLEMFARETREGWTCIGNEIDGLDINEAIYKLTIDGYEDPCYWPCDCSVMEVRVNTQVFTDGFKVYCTKCQTMLYEEFED